MVKSEQSILDFFHREFLPGPDPEGFRTLIEQHGKTVLGLAAALFGHPEKACLAWVVDCVKDIKIRVKEGCVRYRRGIFIGDILKALFHTDARSIYKQGTESYFFSQRIPVGEGVKTYRCAVAA